MGLFKEFFLNESEVSKVAKQWGLKHLGFNHYKDPKTGIVWTWNKDLKKFEKAKEQNMKIYSGDEVDIPYKEYATPPFLKMVKDFDETMNIDVDKAISDRVSSLELQKVIKSAIKRHTKWRDQSGSSALHSAVVLSMSLLLDELRKSMKLSKTTNESLDEDEDLIIEALNKSQYIVKKESLIDWYVNRKDNPTKWIAHIGKEKLGYNVKFNLKFGSIHGKDDKYFFRSMKEAIKFIEEHGDLDESLVNESDTYKGEKITEYTYEVIYKGKKIELSGKNLYAVQPKAFKDLNVPESEQKKVIFILIKRNGKEVPRKSVY